LFRSGAAAGIERIVLDLQFAETIIRDRELSFRSPSRKT
jgi:hypothetical protein